MKSNRSPDFWCEDSCERNMLLGQLFGNYKTTLHGRTETLSYEDVEYLLENLPAVNTILNGVINYIFASEIELYNKNGDLIDDEIKNELFNQRNLVGKTMYEQFKLMTYELLTHGAVGIRKVEDNFVSVPKNTYDIIMRENDEHKFVYEAVLFIVNRFNAANRRVQYVEKYGSFKSAEFNIDEFGNIISADDNKILLGREDFINLTIDDSVSGLSLFEYDKKRMLLILTVLDYFYNDFERNGVGTIALKFKENEIDKLIKENKDNTTASIFDKSATNMRNSKAKREVEVQRLSDKIANLQHDETLIYSDMFDDLKQLNRDSKPSDFLPLLQQYAIKFICQLIGVSPQVFDLEDNTGNVGKDEVVKTFITHKVVPWRKQISDKIEKILHLLGYDYSVGFANEELISYYDYSKDGTILDNMSKMKSLGFSDEEIENYKLKNWVE